MSELSKGAMVAGFLVVFLVAFLLTIYSTRHFVTREKIVLKEMIKNVFRPIFAVGVLLILAILQCLPILILVIVYDSAVETNFLANFWYAILFLLFAILMCVVSGYLLAPTIVAMVAASIPKMNPFKTLAGASEIMNKKRLQFWMMFVMVLVAVIVIFVVVILMIVGLELLLRQMGVEILLVPIGVIAMMSFAEIVMTVYLYLYYRALINL